MLCKQVQHSSVNFRCLKSTANQITLFFWLKITLLLLHFVPICQIGSAEFKDFKRPTPALGNLDPGSKLNRYRGTA